MDESNKDLVIPSDRLEAFKTNQASAMKSRKKEQDALTSYQRSLLPPKKVGRRQSN